jgi:ATP-binding cassette subfamily F protein 3
LLEACADRLWLVADGTVAPFEGDLDDYRRRVLSDRGGNGETADGEGKAEARAARAEERRLAAERRAELTPLRRRIKSAEAEIARLSAALALIDAQLADPDLFTRDSREAGRLAKARADTAGALARAEEDWLEASAAYEDASRAGNEIAAGPTAQ